MYVYCFFLIGRSLSPPGRLVFIAAVSKICCCVDCVLLCCPIYVLGTVKYSKIIVKQCTSKRPHSGAFERVDCPLYSPYKSYRSRCLGISSRKALSGGGLTTLRHNPRGTFIGPSNRISTVAKQGLEIGAAGTAKTIKNSQRNSRPTSVEFRVRVAVIRGLSTSTTVRSELYKFNVS